MRNHLTTAQRAGSLAKGQIWRTRAADIRILGLANQFIHYTVTTRLGSRRTTAQISSIEPMAKYLRNTEARLLNPVSVSANCSTADCHPQRSDAMAV